MPFITHHDGKRVLSEEVSGDQKITCPFCKAELGVRGPFKDGTARHFYHLSDSRPTNCSNSTGGPGESDTHRKLKSLAVSALRQHFSGQYHRCEPEVKLDVSSTDTDVDERRADALLEFTEENVFYGRGIIVEVQHLNRGKNRRGTTHDHLKKEFSVYWATPEEFQDNQFLIEELESSFSESKPAAFSIYHDDPPLLETPEPLPVSEEDGEPFSLTDPVPQCAHEFVPHRVGKICVRCNLKLRRCFFDENQERLRPRNLLPQYIQRETFLAADTTSVEHPVAVKDVENHGEPPDHQHHWGSDFGVFTEQQFRCMRCEAVMFIQDEHIAIQH